MGVVALAGRLRSRGSWLTPARSLLLGFSTLTAAGALLLSLPVASSDGQGQRWLDALFTATSAITTTGLVVVDTGSYYSRFGEWVVLALIQIGGLGYMAFVALLAVLMGRRLSLRTGATLEQSMAGFSPDALRDFATVVFAYTMLFELVGALAFAAYWSTSFPASEALYLGIFHSISTFCTAGFALFPDSFMGYSDSLTLNLTIAALGLGGATGFFALHELWRHSMKCLRRQRPRRLSVHSRLMLAVSVPTLVCGTALFLAVEPAESLGVGFGHRMLTASFQVISAATTTGFNSVDIAALGTTSLFFTVIIMFVGASPGGTGGGIKTTTLGIVVLAATGLLRGKQGTQVFWRRIPDGTVRRALAIGLLATSATVLATLALTVTERAPFLDMLFEVVSALGTVGLSMGLTPNLSDGGRVIICITMLIGRLGPLAAGYALLAVPSNGKLRYAEEDVYIG